MKDLFNLQLFAEDEETMPVMATDEGMPQTSETTPDTETQDTDIAATGTGADGDPAETSEPFKVFQTQAEYQSYFDGVMGKRLKNARENSEKLERFTPLIDALKQQHGITNEIELAEKLKADIVSAGAYREGLTEEQYRKQWETEEQLRNANKQLNDFRHQQFLSALNNDVSKMKQENNELYGGINAEELAEDQKYLALLAHGFSVKEAYDALHISDILKQSAQRTGKQVVDNIVARGERPSESAASQTPAANVINDVSKMSDDEIDALAQRAMRGERIEL
jgi:hypothetical protein